MASRASISPTPRTESSAERARTPTLARRIMEFLSILWNGRTTAVTPAGNSLGRKGEARAARFLRSGGYRVLARNVRVRAGEADLVCRAPDGVTMVIVEVKTRRISGGQSPAGVAAAPEGSVTARKRGKLADVRQGLIEANGWHDRPVRIDAVAIELDERDGQERWTVRHHRGITA